MDTHQEAQVSIVEKNVAAPEIAAAKPTTSEARIHWAATGDSVRPGLEERFEAMRARNWITDKMVQQYQKHWHCSRDVALDRLLAKTGK